MMRHHIEHNNLEPSLAIFKHKYFFVKVYKSHCNTYLFSCLERLKQILFNRLWVQTTISKDKVYKLTIFKRRHFGIWVSGILTIRIKNGYGSNESFDDEAAECNKLRDLEGTM